MSFEENASCVPPPRKSVVRATVAAVEGFKLPAGWMGGWVEIHNDDPVNKMGIKFGATEAEVEAMVNLTSVSSIVSDATEEAASPGCVLYPNERRYFDLAQYDFIGKRNDDTRIWFAHLSAAAAASCYVRLTKSSGPTKA